ncbi:MAG: DNA alkylation repair protein [Alistipes sp.]|jgi:3-methyladenine DNA glycosylase AlkD|nr:DNA alkylation repair protein [Alistipes sp.]
MNIIAELKSIAVPPEDEYREFNRRIVATGREMIGVRMPALRALAKRIAANPEAQKYLATTPGKTYEEVLLYGLVLARRANMRPTAKTPAMPLEELFTRLESLIPLFDSWAHVDVIISDFKLFRRHQTEVFARFAPLKTHAGEFHKRTFVVMMMAFFLDAEHIDTTLEELAGVPQGQYYVDMALAWALAEALVKHYDRTEPLLRRPVFSRFVHNKAIQKARESFRITPEQKEKLKEFKIMNHES